MRYPLLLTLTAGIAAALKCPSLDLPWGKYAGVAADKDGNYYCKYENVRYASPPTGILRFQAPEYPPKRASPSAPQNVACPQVQNTACVPDAPLLDDPGSAPVQDVAEKRAEDSCALPLLELAQQEDCLFLDIWVPGDVSESPEKDWLVPVIVWFYGGAYLFGSKNVADFSKLPLYDGSAFVDLNKDPAIFITGNYRLGAFGWLAGSYMEKVGQPNAGLMDQRAILQFVQDHIKKLHGDPEAVSVWGQSAGASSILHHIASPVNAEKPLFHNALLLSPAYQWLWDREGELNDVFNSFAESVNCSEQKMGCLFNAKYADLAKANQDLNQERACKGIFPVGPSVDGKYIPNLAPYQLREKDTTKLASVLVSHVHQEVPVPFNLSAPGSFIPLPIRQNPDDPSKFDDFLEEFATGDAYKKIRDDIRKKYPDDKKMYVNQAHRAARMIEDASFLCNTRFIIEKYHKSTPTFALDYSFGTAFNSATHGSDLLPLFWHNGISFTNLFKCKLGALAEFVNQRITNNIVPSMQTYFTKFAIYDGPGSDGNGEDWGRAGISDCDYEVGSCVTGVKRPQFFDERPWRFNYQDAQTASSVCDFWASVAKEITEISSKSEKPARNYYNRFDRKLHALNAEL